MSASKHLFGPVASRRLGLSLGVDPVPFKTCTYDCIYCQLGATTNRTLERAEFVPLESIMAEIEDRLAAGGPTSDYVTLSGSGEPTLYSRLGDLIRAIRRVSTIPIAVLTNGSLLWDPAVRADCALADVVLPSLDAGDGELFRYINRPHPDLEFPRIVQGLVDFRKEFDGEIHLEVMLLAGINAIEADLRKLREMIEKIQPDRVEVNTAIRPGTEQYAVRVPDDRLEKCREMLGPDSEVIASRSRPRGETAGTVGTDDILDLLRRRPCSVTDIAEGLSIHPNEVVKRIEALQNEDAVTWELRNGTLFYRASPPKTPRIPKKPLT
jgi:wyosine [tRNA(Phe)-imidazoG37] synthetase (radical SAM superfamily)